MKKQWKPTAEISLLRARAQIVQQIRRFFDSRGVLEVETPVLSAAGAVDLNIQSMTVDTYSPAYANGRAWLHSSPEFAMKRLLCAGSGDIYQICKVFRAEELGSRHNPEFTLLEWYRTGYTMQRLMLEVDSLIQTLATGLIDLRESRYLSYQAAFESTIFVNPLTASAAELAACLSEHEVELPAGCDRADLLDLCMALLVEPRLAKDRLVFIYHYPANQAALSKLNPDDPSVALRFEVFLNGMELANGFEELQDAGEQAARFNQEFQARARAGKSEVPIDQNFLRGLAAGLPQCSGVALGVDRLIMVLTETHQIDGVLSFSASNA